MEFKPKQPQQPPVSRLAPAPGSTAGNGITPLVGNVSVTRATHPFPNEPLKVSPYPTEFDKQPLATTQFMPAIGPTFEDLLRTAIGHARNNNPELAQKSYSKAHEMAQTQEAKNRTFAAIQGFTNYILGEEKAQKLADAQLNGTVKAQKSLRKKVRRHFTQARKDFDEAGIPSWSSKCFNISFYFRHDAPMRIAKADISYHVSTISEEV